MRKQHIDKTQTKTLDAISRKQRSAGCYCAGGKEKWVERRNQFRVKTHSKIVDEIGDQQDRKLARIERKPKVDKRVR